MGTHVIEGFVLTVAERFASRRWQATGKQAATEASDSESRWFFRCEQEQLDGSPGPEARALQGADRFEPAKDADGAVIAAGVRNGINVRAGANCGQFGGRANPARKRVAYRVFANKQAGAFALSFEPGARLQILFQKTMRVTAGTGTAEKPASVSSSPVRRSESIEMFMSRRDAGSSLYRGDTSLVSCPARKTTAGNRGPYR